MPLASNIKPKSFIFSIGCLCIFSVLLAVSPLLFSTEAAARTSHHGHAGHKSKATSTKTTQKYSDIIIEVTTGRVLHATDADSLRHPASLTKMMTLYLTFKALQEQKLRLDQRLPVSSEASEQPPSKIGLRLGDTIRVEDAIYSLVTQSANDVAMVLGEALGGNGANFGSIMTRQARLLGMKSTVFRNPSGLPDPQQITTARDMARLGLALMAHFPKYYRYFSTGSFSYKGKVFANHNHLMERYDGMDGIKTGYIRTSGFNLVASALRGNTRLVGVVFGGRTTAARDNRMAELLDEGFDYISKTRLLARQGAQNSALIGALPTASYVKPADLDLEPPYTSTSASAEADTPPPATSGRSAEYQAPPQLSTPVTARRTPQPLNSSSAPNMANKRAATARPDTAANWGIQIGAFSSKKIAQSSLSKSAKYVPKQIAKKGRNVEKITIKGVPLYRARFIGLNEASARTVCSKMSKAGKNCNVVAPQNS